METPPGPSMYLVFVFLLFLSAFFSSSETAISSVNKMRLRTRAEDGNKKAASALRLANDFDGTLSAILIGNNVVNIASASLATIVATAVFGDSGAAIATAVTTILVLIFGEILPKSYAKENAESFSLLICTPLSWLKWLLTPFVWVFVKIKHVFAQRASDELNVQPSVTEDELRTIIDTVEEEGVLDSQETDMIQSVIDFDNIMVQEILTPRVDIIAADINASAEQLLHLCTSEGVSRLPIYEGNIDHVVGVVHAKDLLACLAHSKPISASSLMRTIMYVYRTKRINQLLADLRRTKQHMAVVTDEHGGTVGLVTMEDILEELVGEIWDESDEAQVPIRLVGEHQWQVDADVKVEDLFEDIDFDGRDFEGDFNTLGAWVLSVLGHIPSEGESFVYETLTLRVQAMDDQRIESLLVSMADPEAE